MKNKKIILFIQLVIVLSCAAGLFGKKAVFEIPASSFTIAQDEEGKNILKSGELSLARGVYRAYLFYETPDDMVNAWEVEAESGSYDGLLANACMLYSGLADTDMYFWLTEKTDHLIIRVIQDEDSQVTVRGACIEETNLGPRMLLVIVLTCFILWDILLFWKGKAGKRELPVGSAESGEAERRIVLFGMALLIVTSSVPLFTGYEIAGADTVYHILRIEGVKDALLAGQFPVRIQPNWLQGYGYATGIFYCDTFLYIPAFLRIMGFPVGAAYLIYKFLVNAGTVVISCNCFGKMFRSRYIGLFAGALYTFSIYRLLSMYIKDHLGQYTAQMFLPLLAYAVWRLLSEETDEKGYRRIWVLLTLGATGIIQCHVLTCELAAVFCFITAVVFYKRTLRKETLAQIGKAFFSIAGLNLWFLVPFFDYMLTQKLIITGEQVYTRTIQGYGSLLPQLFGVFSLAGGADMDVSGGMRGEIPFTVGAALLAGLCYYIYLFLQGRLEAQQDKKYRILGTFSAAMSLVSLFMASSIFPWDKLHALGGFAAKAVSALQYPTRLLGIAALFLTLTGCCALKAGFLSGRKKEAYFYAGTALAALVLITGVFFSGLLSNAGFYKIYEENAIGTYLSGREYLPEGTDEDLLKAGRVMTSEKVAVGNMKKDDAGILLTCQNGGEGGGYVELPLLYYKGYQAKDMATGRVFPVTDGENHVLRVLLPAGYEGTFYTRFAGFWYWRAAEGVSAAALLLFAVSVLRGRKSGRETYMESMTVRNEAAK